MTALNLYLASCMMITEEPLELGKAHNKDTYSFCMKYRFYVPSYEHVNGT
jgi:hypothetical protein